MTKAAAALFGVLALALSAMTGPAVAQDTYPSGGPIRLITPFPTGTLDVVARLIAQKLTTQLNVPVIVEPKVGDNGNIAADYVAKYKPDGYVLLVNTSAVIFSPAYGDKLSYDVLKDLAPVALASASPFVLAVTPGIPSNSLAEFISYTKANPGKLNYGSPGTGGISHLGGLLFLQANGLTATHVPYKGGAQVMTDVVAGRIEFSMQGPSNVLALWKDKRVKALAVTSLKRTPLMPDVPTLSETVMPGFELINFQGVVAPAKTPSAIVKKLNAEIIRAVQEPDVRAKLLLEGAEPRSSSPDEYGAFLKSELERWTKMIKANGIKPE